MINEEHLKICRGRQPLHALVMAVNVPASPTRYTGASPVMHVINAVLIMPEFQAHNQALGAPGSLVNLSLIRAASEILLSSAERPVLSV